MNPGRNPFWPFAKREPVSITPSEAAKVLSNLARVSKAKRAATLEALRECVATGRIAKLEWKA